jgi:hypothetical protein
VGVGAGVEDEGGGDDASGVAVYGAERVVGGLASMAVGGRGGEGSGGRDAGSEKNCRGAGEEGG